MILLPESVENGEEGDGGEKYECTHKHGKVDVGHLLWIFHGL
jgi:hypothetical protein